MNPTIAAGALIGGGLIMAGGQEHNFHVTHLDGYLTGVAKTNSAMKARLMK